MRKLGSLIVASVLSAATLVHAAEVVDQSQTVIDSARGFIGIGGDVEQKLAQTFVAGVTGNLVAIRMPIVGCARGDLVIEVRRADPDGGPEGALLNTTRFDPALVPVSGRALHEFRFSAPVPIRASARYAFTLRMDPLAPAYCNYAHSPLGTDLYPAGDLYYDSRPNPPGWVTSLSTGGQSDLAFETIVETGAGPGPGPRAGRNCLISGGPAGGLPIPETLPVCRCLRDEGLREFRCALLHPDFFAIRRVPFINLNAPYTERWEVLPLTRLSAPIALRFEGENIGQPIDLVFRGVSLKAPRSRMITLKGPSSPVAIKGAAVLDYGKETWRIDRTLPLEAYAVPAPPANLPPSD
ncbi:MAG: hypothetical protein ACK4NP_03155 [Parvularculaceae bacterium]